jgi:hypothetical protein
MPHIISVDDKETYEQFLDKGYIGVRFPRKYYNNIKKGTMSSKKISYFLATVYDIFADLKRVKKNDEIFIHVKGEQKIFGVFRAASLFMENPNIPEIFRSRNLLKERLVNCKLPSLSPADFLWQVSIQSDEKLYFREGFDANEIFKIRELTRKVWTVPERWIYEDKPKTVRPLLPEEAVELYKLLWKYNPKGPSETSQIKPKKLNGFRRIGLPLIPIKGYARDEKLIEAWIMENAIDPEDVEAHRNVKEILGDFDFIANTIRSVYIKFMDVFGYIQEKDIKVYKIIEIKTREASMEHLDQLLGYMDWIATFLCGGTLSRVRGFLIAKEFLPDVFEHLRNKPEYRDLVKLAKYSLYDGQLYLKTFERKNPTLAMFLK